MIEKVKTKKKNNKIRKPKLVFSEEFLKDLAQAEKDIKAGRIRKINSLKDLR